MRIGGVPFYVLLLGVGLLGAVSDAVLNQWAKAGGAGWLVASWAAWCAVATVLGLMFRARYFSFGTATVIFLLANAVFAIAIDVAVFGGKISRAQWAGIALAAAALVVLELGKTPAGAE